MRDRLTSLSLPLSCVATLLIAAACTADQPEGVIEPAPGGEEAAETSPEGPPIAFDPVPIWQSPAKSQRVYGSTYYGLEYEDGDETSSLIRVVDLEDQTQISQAVPEHDRAFNQSAEGTSVRFAKSGEEVLLFHAFEAAEGEEHQVSLRAFDTADGSLRYTGTAPVGVSRVGEIDIVQSEGDTTLVTVDGTVLDEASYQYYETASSFLFDSATGEVVWQSDGFKALRVEGETVIGTAYTPPEGDYSTDTVQEFQVLPLSGGEPSYVYPPIADFKATWLDDGTVLLEDGDMGMFGAQDGYRALLVAIDTESGTGTKLAEVASETEPQCQHDGVGAIGCVGFGQEGLTVMSAADGSTLWTAADIQDYLPPDRFRGAYQGVFYMDNAEGARPPIAVEAATGVKLAEDLPPDFFTVDSGYGFGISRDYHGATTSIYEITERYESD